MEFFELLPTIIYDAEEFNIKNLFYRFDFLVPIPDKYMYNYTLVDGEDLETVAFKIYDDPLLWWLLALINNITDIIFDLPLTTEIIQHIARDQSEVEGVLDLELFSENYDILEEENDQKRIIKVLKTEYLKEVLVNIIGEIN